MIKISYFLILFFLINLSAGGIMNEFLKSVNEEKIYLNKEKSRVLAESGLEIALDKIYKNETPGFYYFQEEAGGINIKIEKTNEHEFFVESSGIFEKGKTKVQSKIIIAQDIYPEIIEKKMW
ncbi:MAG: hypothetical protein PHH19_01475 [Eubacteriales bacterium]|jgi:hypothetical protein|nr:hypothetical protein [Eubacteriales bacterium]NCC81314.1 hypothetical protein [Clostridia bacterium]